MGGGRHAFDLPFMHVTFPGGRQALLTFGQTVSVFMIPIGLLIGTAGFFIAASGARRWPTPSQPGYSIPAWSPWSSVVTDKFAVHRTPRVFDTRCVPQMTRIGTVRSSTHGPAKHARSDLRQRWRSLERVAR